MTLVRLAGYHDEASYVVLVIRGLPPVLPIMIESPCQSLVSIITRCQPPPSSTLLNPRNPPTDRHPTRQATRKANVRIYEYLMSHVS